MSGITSYTFLCYLNKMFNALIVLVTTAAPSLVVIL